MQTTYDNTTIGLDLAKNVFYCTEMNQNMRVVRQTKLKRSQVLKYFSKLEVSKVRCVAMEACGGAHFWGRKFEAFGLPVKLLPPRWVKAYVVNNKTDANDSVAIAEAAQRPRIHSVAVKSVAQQDLTMLHGLRQQALKTRTQWYNSIRAHLSERGLVTGRTRARLDHLMARVLSHDPEAHKGLDLSQVSAEFRAVLSHEAHQLRKVDEKVVYYTKRIANVSAQLDEVRRLQTVPGIGPLVASALAAAAGDAGEFRSGRDFAAWLGLVPRQHSSGGHEKSGGISKCGDRYVRTLLVHGARSVCAAAERNPHNKDPLYCKARRITRRSCHNKAAVAVANQMARISWVILAKGVEYDPLAVSPAGSAK